MFEGAVAASPSTESDITAPCFTSQPPILPDVQAIRQGNTDLEKLLSQSSDSMF